VEECKELGLVSRRLGLLLRLNKEYEKIYGV
jgi:hypothetical protein